MISRALIEQINRASQWDKGTITTSYDESLDNKYTIDFQNRHVDSEDRSVFYRSEVERDFAFSRLLKLIPSLKGDIEVIKTNSPEYKDVIVWKKHI